MGKGKRGWGSAKALGPLQLAPLASSRLLSQPCDLIEPVRHPCVCHMARRYRAIKRTLSLPYGCPPAAIGLPYPDA
ncbi:BZ3500_MvSof-1268-A1-R1_Chr5-3g08283 [Microbotryum saponariae]|uniref:BZ3500_MvSof-1268-A1-R1_Chr5-3g08283 protein n=1 Tax=Microbotryum saponariae TaxID=289078 RepID=A0A2X0MII7_9BASI|nr:BZ3500_MvSof-1268-A1-R1_Chr5-3g08283 [Microbotryum saponariae]SDA08391.1 BZ3501_MvSof-1269-A2-R1_Chr5-3g08011 [Microbotryum saponariae]